MLVPSHVGIKGNIAAKSALTLNISDLKIPFTDFKHPINTFLHNKWQMSWNAAVFNKLHSIKPSLGEWQPNYRIDRKEVTLGRLRIGHTFITHSFWLKGEDWPFCIPCQEPFSVKHVLLDCCSRARADCACSRCGWVLFGHFYFHLSFLSFSLSLGDGPI